MNVNDIKDDVIPTPTEDKDMLDLIFERQHALSQKYIPVEKANGLLQTELFPGDLDDRFSQSRMKDFAWRVQEELYEALDALIIHKDNHVHFIEEMIDALHFYTELCLFCGYTSKDVKEFFAIPQGDDNNKPLDKFEALYQIAKAIDQKSGGVDINIPPALLISVTIGQPIGNAMNKLKNKPWKQTHMVTDKESFKDQILVPWIGFFRVLGNRFGLTAKDVFTYYFKKSEVNKFRIGSKY